MAQKAAPVTERCAFVRRSVGVHYLIKRQRDLENRFDITFMGLQESIASARCESDLICLNVVGREENIKAATNHLNLFFGKFEKTVTYSSKLQTFVENCLLFNLLEMKHNVVIYFDICNAIKITGEKMKPVKEAVSSVEQFLREVKHSSRHEDVLYNSTILESLMNTNIPQHLKDLLSHCTALPGPALELLISWVHQVYDGHIDPGNKSHEESVLILDKTDNDEELVLIVDKTNSDGDRLPASAQSCSNPVDDQDEDDINDSIVVIEPTTEDITLITISDDDDNDKITDTANQVRGRTTAKNPYESKRILPGRLPSISVVSEFLDQPGTSHFTGIKRKRDDSPIAVKVQERKLRPIVIDGSNVAREHGKVQGVFSSKGISLAVNFFLERGHKEIVAFVPQYRRQTTRTDTTDQQVLEQLALKQMVVFTPSRNVDGKSVASYDDRFIVKLACDNGGVILSNDQFRDLKQENSTWKTVIQQRLLMYCFVGDRLMIPDDPLGRGGPTLEEFLSFPPTNGAN